MLLLSFEGIDVTGNSAVSVRDQTVSVTVQARICAYLQTSRNLLFVITVITGLLLLDMVFR